MQPYYRKPLALTASLKHHRRTSMQSLTVLPVKVIVHRAASLLFFLFLCFASNAALSPSIYAQVQNTGSITGTVQDSTGAALAGVQITATNPATGLTRETTSNEDGSFSIPVLPTGTYQLTFAQTGFASNQVNEVVVEAAVPRTIDVQLQVGGVGETVNVTAEGAALVTSESATTARSINAEEIVQVPTSTRSFTHLLSTEAGVSSDLPPVAVNSNGNISPSVNGTRTTSTSLFFNGIDATNLTSNEGSLTDNIAPAPETLEEVKLQTSLYDASTGRSGGGNFQLITKSGTNQFNGSAYYFVQNEKFNANDFFFNRDGLERPRARRNEGGFTIGGPIIKERFFFFGGYQRTQANTGLVPTASSQTTLPPPSGLIPGESARRRISPPLSANSIRRSRSPPRKSRRLRFSFSTRATRLPAVTSFQARAQVRVRSALTRASRFPFPASRATRAAAIRLCGNATSFRRHSSKTSFQSSSTGS
jgi:hypothetical protein